MDERLSLLEKEVLTHACTVATHVSAADAAAARLGLLGARLASASNTAAGLQVALQDDDDALVAVAERAAMSQRSDRLRALRGHVDDALAVAAAPVAL